MSVDPNPVAPMQAVPPILAYTLPHADALNTRLAAAFSSLREKDFERRSHFIGGRFENLYLSAERLPGLAEVLAFAQNQARHLLSSGQASWLDAPIGVDQPLRIGFWINAMQPGQSTSRHAHQECDELISGVYYVAAPAGAGDILFHEPPFETRVRPESGMMLLFAPSLEHSVETNHSRLQRLSVAFNIGPDLR
jgi:hypothetical protein